MITDNKYVDLHIHSCFSDGSMTVEQIVEEALAADVGILAVADHDAVEGSIKIKELCEANDIWYIPAVEISTADNDLSIHLLAYGIDMKNTAFREFINHTKFCLDEMSVLLIERMQPDYPMLSVKEYLEFTYDRRLGGFEALHYLMSKGITESLKEGLSYYPVYAVSYANAGFSTILATIQRITAAGGYSVLAHPGESITTSNIDHFEDELRRFISFGLDGIECYYPSHSEEVTEACLDLCNEYDLLITSSSDCHGTYTGSPIGSMKVTLDQLNLKDLTEREV